MHTKEDWEDKQKSVLESYWLYQDGNLVGFAEFDGHEDGPFRCKEDLPKNKDGSKGFWLSYIGIRPKFIGKGLGKHLLINAIQDAFSKHSEKDFICLMTSSCDNQPAAKNLYQKTGFQTYDSGAIEMPHDR